MGRSLKLDPHLSLEELEQGYKASKTAIARGHYQVIWLLCRGKKTKEVAEVTGYSKAWIYELVRSYNAQGASALGDQRQHNKGGNSPLIDDQMQALLFQALSEDVAPDGGQWNGRKVADWLSERLGRPVHRQRGWELLREFDFSLRRPRPHHVQAATREEQREWEKKSANPTRTSSSPASRCRRRAVGDGRASLRTASNCASSLDR